MNNIWEHLARGLAAVGGFIAGLYGGWSGAMTVLVIVMILKVLSTLTHSKFMLMVT